MSKMAVQGRLESSDIAVAVGEEVEQSRPNEDSTPTRSPFRPFIQFL